MYKDNKTDKNYIIHPGKLFEYNFLDVKQEHGSVFVALCFISYIYPTLSSNENLQTSLTSKTIRSSHKKSRKNKK